MSILGSEKIQIAPEPNSRPLPGKTPDHHGPRLGHKRVAELLWPHGLRATCVRLGRHVHLLHREHDGSRQAIPLEECPRLPRSVVQHCHRGAGAGSPKREGKTRRRNVSSVVLDVIKQLRHPPVDGRRRWHPVVSCPPRQSHRARPIQSPQRESEVPPVRVTRSRGGRARQDGAAAVRQDDDRRGCRWEGYEEEELKESRARRGPVRGARGQVSLADGTEGPGQLLRGSKEEETETEPSSAVLLFTAAADVTTDTDLDLKAVVANPNILSGEIAQVHSDAVKGASPDRENVG
mmetsp:Transcript_38347/g.114811  ORF Transcript_38347/g.114811 Transcript_38347/m.114811 type:complete len:292 (+) Transcript_38347:977-1852(+)